MNGPVPATEKVKTACTIFTDNFELQSLIVQYVDIAAGVASTVLPLIVLIGQYVQTINILQREWRAVFFQIATTHKDNVLRLKQRLFETEGNDKDSSLSTLCGRMTTFVAFFVFIVHTKSLLMTVAKVAEALNDIDPAADATDRTGIGHAVWTSSGCV
ncbi:hypothetical protein BLNAU_2827 [Blattamonas nauphoetae]|uniref:Uncharacterized protein n=1 Tax=Blattamonas nauphoetae TaxID=2049346 RepID=A0ABQ9YEL0_9EUKA|nr:hypothetical protein BLNAU_2827 [Blattamonas nauphoetae]